MEASKEAYERRSFVARLVHAHGWRYVALVFCVYGINQGAGEGWLFFAQQYWLTDPLPGSAANSTLLGSNATASTVKPHSSFGLGLSPARYAEIDAVTNIPWQIKALYGVSSDVIPLFGYHKMPYMVMASLIGLLSFSMLWISPLALTTVGSAMLLLLANLSIASPDVMIDGSVAEKSSAVPFHAADLQSLCWMSFGAIKVVSLLVAPWVFETYGSRALFGLCALTSLAMGLPSILNWLGEEPDFQPKRGSAYARVKEFAQSETAGPFVRLAFLLTAISTTMGLVSMRGEHSEVSVFAVFIVTPLTAWLIYRFESKVDGDLARFSLYVFLSGAIQPSAPVLFYWMKADEENCSRNLPCFSPEFIANLSIVGYITFVAGTGLYNRFLTRVSYKRIYTLTQMALFFLNMIDLIWVNRLNLAWGISDKAFVLGDEVIAPMVARWNTMPMLILSAVLCPPQIYATFFALNMGISNFGKTLGGYFGVGLMQVFNIDKHQYESLPEFIVVRSLFRILPLILIPFLLPEGSPDEPPKRPWETQETAEGGKVVRRAEPTAAASELVSLTAASKSAAAVAPADAELSALGIDIGV